MTPAAKNLYLLQRRQQQNLLQKHPGHGPHVTLDNCCLEVRAGTLMETFLSDWWRMNFVVFFFTIGTRLSGCTILPDCQRNANA